jgi:hypothetical protein
MQSGSLATLDISEKTDFFICRGEKPVFSQGPSHCWSLLATKIRQKKK